MSENVKAILKPDLENLLESGKARLEDGVSLEHVAYKLIIHFVISAGVMMIGKIVSSSSEPQEENSCFHEGSVDHVSEQIYNSWG